MPSSLGAEHRVTYHTSGPEASRLYAKKTIVVGNVSKYVLTPMLLNAKIRLFWNLFD